MLYWFTGVMNNIHIDRAVANSSFPSWADKYSSFKNRNKRAVVVPLENIAKQLESVAILTNAIILTEAVRSENISVGEIMINSLIIGQMPKDINWIEMLGSVKLDATKVDTFKKLVTEMKALKITFDTEKPVDVPVNLLTKLNPEAIQSLSKIAASFSDLLDVDSSLVELVHNYDVSIARFTLLPYTTEAIKKSGNFSELGELVKVVNFIEKTQEISGLKLLEESVNECKTSDPNGDKNEESLKNCLSKLKKLTESILEPMPSLPLLKQATMAFNFLSVASHISNIKNLTEIEESINGTIQQLGTILPLLEQIRNAANNEKPKISFQQIVTDLNSLKESSLGMESLKKSLDLFIPVAQTVEGMIDLYGTGNMKSSISSNEISFLNAFKSYKCLPNGADSINILKDVLGSSQSLSLEYIMSGIAARLPVIEEYLSIYNPIIQNSAGLKAVEQLSTGISNLTENSNPIITSNLSGTFDEIIKIIPEVSGIEESLKSFVDQIKQLKQKSNWEKDLRSLNKPSILKNAEFDSLTEIFLIVPEYFEFVSKIKSILLNLDIKSSDHTVLKSHYEKMKDIIVSLPTAVQIAEKINKKTDLSVMKQIAETVPKMKEALKKGKTFEVSKLKPTEDVDLKVALNNIEKASSIQLVFNKMQFKKTEIQSFAKEIDAINIFSNSLKPITDEDVRSTQLMLTGMKEIRERKKTMTESYQVATLMEGNPFGNDILDNMYKGINDYQMIAKRIGSLKNVHDAINQLEDGNEQLMADIRKFLKEAEVLEITPVENIINVYDVIMNIPSIISNLEKLEKWIRTSFENNEKTTIEKRLNDLKSNDSPMIQQISMIHFFVHKIDQNFVENVSKLRKGFEMFEKKLTYVDCKKNPEIPRCHNGIKGSSENLKRNSTIGHNESNDSKLETIVICVIVFLIVVLFMILGFVIYSRCSAAKKRKRYSTIQHFSTDFAIFRGSEQEDENMLISMIFFEMLSLENKSRNVAKKFDEDMIRDPEIGLYKNNRVKLNSEVNGIVRVHASYIQMHNSKWIVCQAPLPKDNCNEAMFEMLLQENVKVIVQFYADDEEKEVTYCASGKYGRYEVTKTIVTENEPFDHCTLKVADKKKNIDVTINHLQFKISSKINRPDILSAVDLMEKVQELSGKGVVLVHCLNGNDLSILFVSMVHMTDMLNDGKKVIIRDVVNDMRKQRYGALTTVGEYAYLLGLMARVCAKKNPKEEEKKFSMYFEKYSKL